MKAYKRHIRFQATHAARTGFWPDKEYQPSPGCEYSQGPGRWPADNTWLTPAGGGGREVDRDNNNVYTHLNLAGNGRCRGAVDDDSVVRPHWDHREDYDGLDSGETSTMVSSPVKTDTAAAVRTQPQMKRLSRQFSCISEWAEEEEPLDSSSSSNCCSAQGSECTRQMTDLLIPAESHVVALPQDTASIQEDAVWCCDTCHRMRLDGADDQKMRPWLANRGGVTHCPGQFSRSFSSARLHQQRSFDDDQQLPCDLLPAGLQLTASESPPAPEITSPPPAAPGDQFKRSHRSSLVNILLGICLKEPIPDPPT